MRAAANYVIAALLIAGVMNMSITPAKADVCTNGYSWQVILFGGFDGSDPCKKSNSFDTNELNKFYEQISAAAEKINALPDEINKAGPAGQTLSNITAGITQIAGYVKWLFSGNTAQELLGKTFAPIGINIMVIFLMTVAMVTIYIAVNTIVYTIKMVIFLMNLVLKVLPFW